MNKEPTLKETVLKGLGLIEKLTLEMREVIETVIKAAPAPITVPEGIKIIETYNTDNPNGLGIVNPNEQTLYFSKYRGQYGICPGSTHRANVSCKLTPCSRSELKAGDVAFRTDYQNNQFASLYLYCVIINDTECVFWQAGGGLPTEKQSWKHWYKAEPI